MKQGKSISELSRLVQHEAELKHDFTAPAYKLHFNSADKNFILHKNDHELLELAPTDHSLLQVTDYVQIPRRYARYLAQEAPDLLGNNINYWLEKDESTRMIRTVDNQFRALLSDRYRRLDNLDLLHTILPVLSEKNISVRSTELTETRMYLKVTIPTMQADIKEGDTVEYGLCISNSEVGAGSVSVSFMIYVLACTNGLISQKAVARHHIGKRFSSDAELTRLLSEATCEADDRAFWMGVRDIVTNSLTREYFEEQVELIKQADKTPIKKKVKEVVELSRKTFSLSDSQGEMMLENLIRGNEFTRWGLSNSITALANTTENYEEATRLEHIGGDILHLKPREWLSLAG